MLKKDIVAAMGQKFPNLSEEEVKNLCDKIFFEILEALKNNKRVEIRGFGVFFCRHRSSYVLRSPRDGEMIEVVEKKIPRFKAGRQLIQEVNNGH